MKTLIKYALIALLTLMPFAESHAAAYKNTQHSSYKNSKKKNSAQKSKKQSGKKQTPAKQQTVYVTDTIREVLVIPDTVVLTVVQRDTIHILTTDTIVKSDTIRQIVVVQDTVDRTIQHDTLPASVVQSEHKTDTCKTDTVVVIKDFAPDNILHENILQISGGWSKTLDTYLSPLVFSGFQHSISNEWWQTLRKNENFGHVGRVEAAFGRQRNHAHSNDAYSSSNGLEYYSAEGGWGIFSKHHSNYLNIGVGPFIGANVNIKNIYSSYNKPLSVDVAADLSLMFSIGTAFSGPNTSYRLRYIAYLNVLGVQFLPDFWQSYYELDNTLSHNIHFSYIGQRVNLRHELTFDIQLPHTTWRAGIRHEYTNYGTNDMRLKSENLSIVLGSVFNYKINGKVNIK